MISAADAKKLTIYKRGYVEAVQKVKDTINKEIEDNANFGNTKHTVAMNYIQPVVDEILNELKESGFMLTYNEETKFLEIDWSNV